MIAVPYFEKALYEMDEKDLTPENVLKVADEVEMKIQGGLAGRPLMSVPHILADESSCYYHGYVFAEMAVHQTREYFFKTGDGTIVDNPRVGKELIENYWVHGSETRLSWIGEQPHRKSFETRRVGERVGRGS